MKLELKHIAPYLPYGISILHTEFSIPNIETVTKIDSISSECTSFERSICDYYFDNENTDCAIDLILRPMSDLTKEIEHNGEKFIPIDRIKKGMLVDFEYIDREGVISIHYPTGKISLIAIGSEIVDECPIGFFYSCIKWHFDCFNLLGKGLAIDINTLNE